MKKWCLGWVFVWVLCVCVPVWGATYKLKGVVHEINWSKCSSVVLDELNPSETYRTVWAKVGAAGSETVTGLPFSKQVALKINAVAGSKLGRLALAAGKYLPYISVAAELYLASKDWEYNTAGPEVLQTIAGTEGWAVSSEGLASGTVGPMSGTLATGWKYVVDRICNGCQGETGCACGTQLPPGWSATAWGGTYDAISMSPPTWGWRVYTKAGFEQYVEEVPGTKEAVAWVDVESGLLTDLGLGDYEAWDFVRQVGLSHDQDLNLSDEGWPSSGPEPWESIGSEHSNAEGEEIQDTYDDSVTPDIIADLENADPDNPDSPYGGWEDWEYSPDEIASAIDEKNRALLNDSSWSGHTEGDPDIPDKESITDKLSWFQSALESLPMVDVLDSLQIEALGADCNFCVGNTNMAGGDAGESCYSFCEVQGAVDAVGALLFAMTCIWWIIYIFRSGA